MPEYKEENVYKFQQGPTELHPLLLEKITTTTNIKLREKPHS